MPEEDCLILEHPLEVIPIEQPKNKLQVTGFTLVEWIRSTFDQMFILPKQHVLTISETDKKIESFYKRTLKKLNSGVDGSQFTRKMGRLGSVSENRKFLEKLYKL